MPYIGRELDRGNYLKLDDISSSFDGSTTTFNLTNGGNAFYPGSAFSILVVLAGVVQEPEAAYQINQSQITFASAPLAGDQFFCITLGQALGVNTPANGSVNGAQLAKPFNYDNYFYLDDANNRVGVGTATPMTPLHVEGTGRFTDLTVTGDLTVEGTTSTLDTVVTEVDKLEVLANNSTVAVAVTQSGSGDAATFEGGNVGIGTNNAGQKLHVSGGTGTNIQVQQSNGNLYLGSSGSTRFGLSSGANIIQSAAADFGIGSQSGHNLIFGTNNAKRLSITDQGDFHIQWNNNNFLGSYYDADYYMGLSFGSNRRELYIDNRSNDTRADIVFRTVLGQSDPTEKLRITSGGNVGIGTDDPQSQFEVYGTSPIVRSKHSTSQKYTQINHDGTDGYVDWSSGGLIFRGASNAERLRITSAGNVGIGLTNPDWHLDIKSTSVNAVVRLRSSASTNGGQLQVNSDDLILRNRDAGNLQLWTNDVERLRIDSGGAVNIGDVWADDSDPMAYITKNNDVGSIVLKGNGTGTNNAFAIYGGGWSGSTDNKFAIRADGSVWGGQTSLRFGTGSTYTERLRITDGGQVRIGNSTITVSNSADDLIIGLDSPGGDRGVTIISGTSGTGNIFFSDTDTSGVGNRMGTITYDHSGNFMRFSTAGNNERLRITSGGNLQVKGGNLHLDSNAELALFEDNTSGTYTNSAKIAFDFSGNVARMRSSVNGSATLRDLAFYTANTAAIYIKTDANVGIGENAPNTRLHIVKDNNVAYTPDAATQNSNNQIKIENHSTTTDSFVSMAMRARACDFHLGVKNDGDTNAGRLFLVHQDTTNKEVLSVLSTGSVGIGTVTPSTKLEVQGDVTATNYVFEADYPTSAPTLDLNFAREKKLDSRITFTRNSVATYFDAQSSEVLEENNMDYASNFSGQWTTQGFASVSTSSWARPIPGWDSQEVTLFTENTSSGTHRVYRSFQNYFYDNDQLDKVYTISFFAKYSSGRQFLQLNGASLNYSARVIFDIQNGSVSDYGSALYAGVISHGNGWYRCWATIRADTVSPVQQTITCPVGGNGTATGNGESYTGNGSNFYLWGYQVEFSDTLGPFVQTNGKTFRKLGPVIKTVPVDEPRFVYDPSTKESLGLLIEQEATNQQPFTNNLTSAIATNGGSSEVSTWSNIVRAPNGLLEGGRVKGSGASGGSQRIYFNYGIANGEDGAWSLFLKADPNNGGDIIVQAYTNTFIANNSALNINLNDGTYNAVTPSNDLFYRVESYPNGWYRVTMGGTSSGATNGSMNINIVDSTSAARAATSSSDKAYFIWGVQFETGSLNASTSYIENTSTGTKTRSSELAQVRGTNFSSWFNNTEGTILAEYRGGALTSEIPLHISDESYRNSTSIQIGSSSSGPVSGYVTSVSINNRGTSEASWQANTAYPTEGESIKTALTYKHNYAQMVTTDGSGTYTGSVDTSVNLPWLNMMTIGKDSYYGIWNNNPIKRLAFYGNTLTEAQLQNIVKY